MPVHILPRDQNSLDKKTLDPTYYVDIKSERLRSISRTVLRDICTVNLNEDNPAVLLSSSLLIGAYR